MRIGSLFAGIGGFDLAAEAAGHTVAWQSEVDPSASRVLEHHWPGKNLGDIHDIGRTEPVQLLAGGFPCQDYSVAGTGAGLAGDRGALWWEFHRLIDANRPEWVIGENVPGLLTRRHAASFQTIIESLVELGYGVVWGVLDAQYFGVPQRRRRLFIVGHSGGIPRPEVLALGEGLFGHPEPRREAEQEVASPLVASTPKGGRRTTDLDGHGAYVPVLYSEAHGEDYREAEATGPITEGAGSRRLEQIVAFAANQRDEVRELEIPGALESRPGMKQRTFLADIDNLTVRRLTPLECERLQGFPDGHTAIEGNSDTQRYRQLGNAVAVPVATWIMERIPA